MFAALNMALDWLPISLHLPIKALLSVLIILALVKFVSAVLAVISAILSIIIPWK